MFDEGDVAGHTYVTRGLQVLADRVWDEQQWKSSSSIQTYRNIHAESWGYSFSKNREKGRLGFQVYEGKTWKHGALGHALLMYMRLGVEAGR